jgi:2,4-dienoyl-CoA reductase-like NADH-dependent reductase (Old Yellow Enzyme family)
MGMSFGKPRAATKEDIARIIDGFAHAAEFLNRAGFDGIELHAAHGYLIAQFLSRTTNKRTDEYGADTMANRTRLITEITRAIRARVSPGFMLGAKLNSVEFQEGGVTPEEGRELCATLAELGFDFVEVSGGTYEEMGLQWDKESTRKREAFFIEFAKTVVDGLGDAGTRKTKAYIVGGLRSVGAMVKALNVVDGVSLARPAAQEPRLAADIIEGRVKGAIKAIAPIENNFGLGMMAAGMHLRQVGKGDEPFNTSDQQTVDAFLEDTQKWFAAAAQAVDGLERHGYPDFTGETRPYGVVGE